MSANSNNNELGTNSSTTLTEEEKKRLANKKKKEKQKAKKLEQVTNSAAANNNSPSEDAENQSNNEETQQNKPEIKENKSSETKSAESELAILAQEFGRLSMHKFFTDPIKLAYNKKKGRHVLASQPIPAGTTIFTIAPYVGVVLDAVVDKICHRCFSNPTVLYKCNKCDFARFCSTSCMNAMSRVHNLECSALAKFSGMNFEGETAAIRMIIRILYLHTVESALENKNKQRAEQHKKGALWTAKPGLSLPDAYALISHQERFDSQHILTIKFIISKLSEIVEPSAWQGTETATKLLLQVQCNAHHLTDSSKNRIGLALYIPAAYLNHSCRPSCVYSFNKQGEIEMRTIRELQVGEECSYSYIDLYQSRARRAQVLKDIYFIDSCYCARCTQQSEANSFDRYLDAFQCNSCRKGIISKKKKQNPAENQENNAANSTLAAIPVGNFYCSECFKQFSANSLAETESDSKLLFNAAISNYSSGETGEAIRFLEGKLLQNTVSYEENDSSAARIHPFHALAFNSYTYLAYLYRETKNFVAALHYSQLSIDCMQRIELFNHPELADALHSKADLLLSLIASKNSTEYTAESKEKTENSANFSYNRLPEGSAELAELAAESLNGCIAIRNVCYGKKHERTKEAVQKLHEVEHINYKPVAKKK
jgi:hypothetical protein